MTDEGAPAKDIDTKGHEPPEPSRETSGGDEPVDRQEVSRALDAHRDHSSDSDVHLGHRPASDQVVHVIGETHEPAQEAPPPSAAPPKPLDAAQSVTAPEKRETDEARDE